jgi:hypothetical protein
VTWLKWNLVSIYLGMVLIMKQDSVCDESIIGSKIILDTPDGTPR